MAKRIRRQKTDREQAGGGHPHVLAHFILGCSGLLAIAYGAALLLSRTEGMRYLVRDRIEAAIGMPASIGAMRMTPALDAILEDISLGETNTIQVRKVEIAGSLREKLKGGAWMQSVRVAGCTLTLKLSPSGRWTPAALEPLSGWSAQWCGIKIPVPPPAAASGRSGAADAEKTPDAAAQKFETAGFHRIPVTLVGGKIIWRDAEGNELASAGDIEVHLTPLKTQAREIQHVVLSAGHIRSAAGDYITGLFVELLSTQGHHILLGQRANRTRADQAAPPPVSAYDRAYESGVPDYAP